MLYIKKKLKVKNHKLSITSVQGHVIQLFVSTWSMSKRWKTSLSGTYFHIGIECEIFGPLCNDASGWFMRFNPQRPSGTQLFKAIKQLGRNKYGKTRFKVCYLEAQFVLILLFISQPLIPLQVMIYSI